MDGEVVELLAAAHPERVRERRTASSGQEVRSADLLETDLEGEGLELSTALWEAVGHVVLGPHAP